MTDSIDRLRAVNPVPEADADPSDPAATATLEEILMTDPTAPPAEPLHRAPRPRPLPWLVAAAALLLVAGVAGAFLLGGDDSTGEATDQALPDPSDTPGDAPRSDADPGATSSATSCVELYSPETLPNRDYAFDGTVASVDGPDITFTVHEAFSGPDDIRGEGATITLDHQGNAGMLFSPEGPALEPGTRVLAAGDDGFLWSCGFTQLHTEELADEWRGAFGGG